MMPNRVPWWDIGRETYEDMVSVLISWLHPKAQRIDGTGGDGGRDVQVPTDNGILVYQLKSFTGRMNGSRRRQVKASLAKAAQDELVGWCLVVPIDPTPDELEWFEGLVERYRFECSWLGKTWLDRQMAEKTAIARYYAHDGRFALHELIEVLERIGADPSPVKDGIVKAAADQVKGILQQVNELDPHYVFGFAFQPDGGVSVTELPRYPGAEKDSPRSLKMSLAFPATEEGESAHQAFQDTLNYGTLSVIPAEFITEARFDPPRPLDTDFEDGDWSLSSPAPDLVTESKIVLKAVDQRGEILARLPLDVENATKGMRGSRLNLKDKSGALGAVATFDGPTSQFRVDVSYTPPQEYWPLDLLPAVNFMAAVGPGADMVAVVNGKEFAPQGLTGFQPSEAEGLAKYAEFLGHLSYIQTKTGVFFDITGRLTAEEEWSAVFASQLLNGERVQGTWDKITLQIAPGARESVEETLCGPPKAMRSTSHLTISIQGNDIPVGRLVEEIDSARVQARNPSTDSEPHETATVTLVPGDTDKVTRFLSADLD